jgi:tetratricopeptide (TPR) repeat protein
VIAALVEIPALIHANAVAFANRNDWAAARGPADDAVGLDRAMPIYRLTAGLAAAHAGDYASAAEDFEVIAAAGDLPQAWLNLAEAYLQIDDPRAHDALIEALHLGAQQPAVAVPATAIALALGDRDLAVTSAEQALLRGPTLAGDAWWHADPAREAVFAAAYARAASAGGPAIAWQLAFFAGDIDAAAQIAESMAGGSGGVPSLIVAASQGRADAYRRLLQACLDAPADGWVSWCAFVAAKRGDNAAADRFETIAGSLYPNGGRIRELRVSNDLTQLSVAGSSALLYGLDAYRRFTPWDMLAPGLVHLETH